MDMQRRESLVVAMRSAGLAGLLCFSPSDVLLLTGYWPVMGASIAVMSLSGASAVIVPEDELELARASTDAYLIPYKVGTLEALRTLSEAIDKPSQEMSERVPILNGSIGASVAEGDEPLSYQSVNRFHLGITKFLEWTYPHARLVPADSLLNQAKSVRTSIEMEQLRSVCKLAHTGFEAARDAIVVGRTEAEVAADIESAFNRVASDGFERGRGYFYCMSGPNSAKAAAAFARTRNRTLEHGDFVMIHTNTVGDGVWTDITRTYAVGEPGERQQNMMAAVAEARNAALAAVRPGVSAANVDAAGRAVLTHRGYGHYFPHAIGHGVGYAAANANALPRLHPKSDDVLVSGMTFNLEPAIYIRGFGGVRHCDVVACTDSGAEVLTEF